MATTVSTGIRTLGNRTFYSGAASGIDTAALVEVAYNARKIGADKIDVQVGKNTTKATALSKLQTLTQSVQDSIKSLRKDYSILATNTSFFGARNGTLSSSSATSPGSLVSVTIDNGTALGSYQLEVQQKASAQKIGSNDTFTDKTTALGYTGTFDISQAGGTASTINVTAGMTLDDLATAINGTSATSGVTASVLKISSSSYQLIISAKDTNKAITIGNVTGTDVMTSIGVTASSGGAASHVIQAAQGSRVVLDGVTTTRDSNDYSDLIDGVHINILNAETGTKLQLGIVNDNSKAKDGITAFVSAYNSLRDYVVSNQTLQGDGTVSADSVLFGDPTLSNLSGDIQSIIASSYGAGGTTLSTLLGIGISLDGDGKMQVDEAILDTALTDKFTEVQAMFETSVSSDNPEFRMMGNTSETRNLSAAIDITYSGGAITSVSVGGDNSLFDVTGNVIKGKSGTAYEGMTFAYIGTTSTTVNFNLRQGFADVLNTKMNKYTDVVTGSIQAIKLELNTTNTDLESRKADILARADDYRLKLIDKYAGYEAKMARAQAILTQLSAVLNQNNNN